MTEKKEPTYKGIFNTDDLIGLGLSVAYDSSADYKKVNTTMLMEKTSYHLGGNLLQPIVKDLLPKFIKNSPKDNKSDKGDFFYYGSHQKHLTTGLLAGLYTYYGKNQSFKKAMISGALEGLTSYTGDYIRRSLSQNPEYNLENQIWL